MTKERAIPDGYLTVGQLASKMNTTARTIQYYDRIGLLEPAMTSEGGRRLYTDREVMRLHQIQTLQHLGFSLEDIRLRLSRLETPEEVEAALAEQERRLQIQIAELEETASQIRALRKEVLAMGSVDFHKYADIVINMQMRNPYFWLLKYMDEETLSVLRSRFDVSGAERFISELTELLSRAARLEASGAAPGDPESIRFAKEYWALICDITNGEPELLESLRGVLDALSDNSEEAETNALALAFIENALTVMFEQQEEAGDE